MRRFVNSKILLENKQNYQIMVSLEYFLSESETENKN